MRTDTSRRCNREFSNCLHVPTVVWDTARISWAPKFLENINQTGENSAAGQCAIMLVKEQSNSVDQLCTVCTAVARTNRSRSSRCFNSHLKRRGSAENTRLFYFRLTLQAAYVNLHRAARSDGKSDTETQHRGLSRVSKYKTY